MMFPALHNLIHLTQVLLLLIIGRYVSFVVSYDENDDRPRTSIAMCDPIDCPSSGYCCAQNFTDAPSTFDIKLRDVLLDQNFSRKVGLYFNETHITNHVMFNPAEIDLLLRDFGETFKTALPADAHLADPLIDATTTTNLLTDASEILKLLHFNDITQRIFKCGYYTLYMYPIPPVYSRPDFEPPSINGVYSLYSNKMKWRDCGKGNATEFKDRLAAWYEAKTKVGEKMYYGFRPRNCNEDYV